MRTDALIESLSALAEPVPRAMVWRRLALGAGAGGAVSLGLMLAWLGVRPDLAQAMATGAYWMKFFYTLVFAGAAFWTLERLSRPGAPSRSQMLLEALPFAAVAAIAAVELMGAAPSARHHLMMGASAGVCPWRIVLLALPVLAGAIWSVGRLAPTRPVLAGIGAGLAAGALGAFIYAFHCDESAAPFVAIWYTLGIAAVGALGGLLGRLFLRW
ncbi:MAG: DUF1109 domain-containing protein [Alphaproteobacteria bacterium]|nr:DUF1109 domain-containing protein [Alphaproteobacteria bacterium]MBV9694036.1 DUF1109 domain-containing protein [Alphaproteobacteria bacterium]